MTRLKCHMCGLPKGKGKLSQLNIALIKRKQQIVLLKNELQQEKHDLDLLRDQIDFIDPEDDLGYEIAKADEKQLKNNISKLKSQIKNFNKDESNPINLELGHYYHHGTNPKQVGPSHKPAPPPSKLGGIKSGLTLHAVIVKKPFDLNKAREIARDVMKSNKDKFMRETSTSYRFRSLPKTKFSSFITKVINPNVSLIFGNLK